MVSISSDLLLSDSVTLSTVWSRRWERSERDPSADSALLCALAASSAAFFASSVAP